MAVLRNKVRRIGEYCKDSQLIINLSLDGIGAKHDHIRGVEHNFEYFEHTLKPTLDDNGASVLAYFVTESSANNFPALPVREGENVLIWFSLRDQMAYQDHCAALFKLARWRGEVSQEITRRLRKPPEVLKLSPTARSQLRG